MEDSLGNRMKTFYEDRAQTYLLRRLYTLMRLDGKAFHSYTKGFDRPYDERLMRIMDQTAIELCKQIQGAKMAFVQSDEITILITDFETIKTDAWFDYNVQKMTSISASIATVAFNNGMYLDEEIMASMDKVAYFDSRVWQVPDVTEVFNNFVWRQKDATRNSIQMAAQSVYSHKELHGKNSEQLQEMLWQKGINWNDYPVGFKRGRMILKDKIEFTEMKEFSEKFNETISVERRRWASYEPPIFTQEPSFLLKRIPNKGE